MVLFTVKNLTKKFDKITLFENISFGMNLYDRIGLIGRNGIGKSTLLNIIAGKEYADDGEVV
ncbi:MAG TPA: ATP-binding cassette domain-containing protein, partial [Candidatus Kapabacteria bacterium]|nr:ATP-binding cassette domain-containing protein [Candidatus Kapabacteria bacterium]